MPSAGTRQALRLIPAIQLCAGSLTQMGTRTESFTELTERMGRKTGGISVGSFVSDVKACPFAMLEHPQPGWDPVAHHISVEVVCGSQQGIFQGSLGWAGLQTA